MDKYAFSGSHFEKSKMAAMRISVQMETLVFWLLMPYSFQKCIVFLIPKKIPRNWKFKHNRPDYKLTYTNAQLIVLLIVSCPQR